MNLTLLRVWTIICSVQQPGSVRCKNSVRTYSLPPWQQRRYMRNQPVAVRGFFLFFRRFVWGPHSRSPSHVCRSLGDMHAKARRGSQTPCFEVRAGAYVPTLLVARIEVRRCRAVCLPLFAIASETAGFSLANSVFFFVFFFCRC